MDLDKLADSIKDIKLNSKIKTSEISLNHNKDNGLVLLLIGDPHFKLNNVDKTNTLLQDVLKYVDDWGVHVVICLGDILDRHENAHVHVHQRATKFLISLANKVPTILLIGNHDRPNNSVFLTDEHFFTGLQHYPNLDIVDLGLLKIVNLAEHKYNLLCMPYVPPGTFRKALTHVGMDDLSNVDAVFAHQEIQGCVMGSISSSVGDVWTATDPAMYSGHIHERQALPKKGQANVHLIGTPFQHNRAESPEKGIARLILAPERGSHKLEYFPLHIDPMMIKELTPAEVYTYVAPEGVDLHIVVKGKAEELKMIEKIPQMKILKKLAKVSTKEIKEDATMIKDARTYVRTNYWTQVASRLNERQQQLLLGLLVKQ